MKLFHVSEESNITEFAPRYSSYTKKPVVWAIAESKLANYLLPRDCPRVCFSKGEKTSAADSQHLGLSRHAIAIETSWFARAVSTTLYLYEMPNAAFNLYDAIAGYYIADAVVIPIQQHIIERPIEVLAKNVELRILPSLWQLHDAVIDSTLDFSIIRMKNARPRPS